MINFAAMLLAGLVVWLLTRGMMSSEEVPCALMLKKAFQACQIYAIENDERFPDAEHWMTRIQPQQPIPLRCNRVEEGVGYAFNDNYSAQPIPSSGDTAGTLIFDSTKLGRNEHDVLESLPKPGRHSGSNNLIHTDGSLETR